MEYKFLCLKHADKGHLAFFFKRLLAHSNAVSRFTTDFVITHVYSQNYTTETTVEAGEVN